jgi:hypothetical protein
MIDNELSQFLANSGKLIRGKLAQIRWGLNLAQ